LKVNRLRELRESRMMSGMELARRAGLSLITVSRVEKGRGCRIETKRKILTALGLSPGEKEKVFPKA
jgi:transcriptional regulator with XRE-family HTH domain